MSTEGWKALKEKVGANSKNRFVWSPSYIDALVTRDRDSDANIHVTAITNTSGTVQERYTPDPFGVETFWDA